MPFTVIEWALRLVCLILEGVPPEQRKATAIMWFWMWWPLGKLWLNDEQRTQIMQIMEGTK